MSSAVAARLLFWAFTMAYTMFLIVSENSVRLTLSIGISATLLGGAAGVIFGIMFAERAARSR